MKTMRSLTGFTLVEIMIVVAIIVLLAGIAIPAMLRAKVNANASAAVAAMHTLSSAAQNYRAANPSYPLTLNSLSSVTPFYIDSVLGSGARQGYSFYISGTTNTFVATAVPVTWGSTGTRSFFVDTSGVIRYTDVQGASPTANDPVLD